MRGKLLTLLSLLITAGVYGQGFQVNLAGQQQIGMGHTGTGLAQDGAAIFFNPGAVAQLPDNYVQGGISPLFFKSAFQGTGSNVTYHNSNEVATPFSAYAIWGPKDAIWKAGIGVYTPFGGLVNWGNNWQGKYALESLDLKAIFFQPTLSVRLGKYISVGGGFVFSQGSVNLKRALPLANSAGDDGQAELKGHGHGYGWNAGIFLDTHTGLTAGVSYKSKATTTINGGDAIFTVPGAVQANFPQPNSFSASLPLPATTSVGLGYKINSQWLVAVDANFTNWSVFKSLSFDYANNTAVLQDTNSPRNYKNSYSLRGGVQYTPIFTEGSKKYNSKWAIRAGGGYASSAPADGYVTPEVPDANRIYFTGGLGYKITRNFNVDVSFEYEYLKPRTQTNIETQLSGTYKTEVYIPGISIAYHW
ncbi:OmpP1/FadL family transporter [Mucilaginibacter sp. KACC 22063]|uniref:OmpP1/FadL family transporter n=1 Tax=Mucilaginibacter sp. KACC 22063 TaxID=3025666 RepID=UPI00236639F1|nr:outer membrane protein transport protein [Mucilaginibacter sp. KACC 22063]WDF53877.1 outer membrane protein transport protein [Mucilaginibacter sp. KACC 22063]